MERKMITNLRTHWKKSLVVSLAAALVVFGVIQLIPVSRTNPPIVAEPAWDSPQTRTLVENACFTCHSNETQWSWYSKIAPVSWLTSHDVTDGREHLNFSDWDQHHASADEITEVINSGEMPPWYYTIMHSEARLSDQEKADLIAGLQTTFAQTASNTGSDS
jgi:mono/diheme cytochrome c family protein